MVFVSFGWRFSQFLGIFRFVALFTVPCLLFCLSICSAIFPYIIYMCWRLLGFLFTRHYSIAFWHRLPSISTHLAAAISPLPNGDGAVPSRLSIHLFGAIIFYCMSCVLIYLTKIRISIHSIYIKW